MALNKTPVAINFVRGLSTKEDPYQVDIGNFLALNNTVFSTTKRLTKRNGFTKITTLPNALQTNLTTLNDNLIATGTNLNSFSQDTNQWINQGNIQPIHLETQSLVRNSTSQSGSDIAIAANGLTALVYMDSGNSYYHIIDSSTGAQIVARTQLPATATNPKVFILGKFFIITFIATVAAVTTLQYKYVAISNPTVVSTAINISADVNSLTAGYDAEMYSNKLYIAWGASSNTVKITSLSNTLGLASAQAVTGTTADVMSVSVSAANNRVFIVYSETSGDTASAAAFTLNLTQVMARTQFLTSVPVSEITTIAPLGVLNIYYEVINTYAYGTALSDYIETKTITLPVSGTGVGTISSATIILRSVGLASKAFVSTDGTIYMLATYGDPNQASAADNSNQPTYFLIDSTGAICMRLAYSNGGGYQKSNVLPKVSLIDDTYYTSYSITDFLATVNKGTSLPSGTPVNSIYTQTGINLAKFQINASNQYNSEIAGALHLTGGQLWEFDGVKPVEHGFHVWPENLKVTTSGAGGLITAQTYFYSFTYEWTDNAGMLHRSAPSIPLKIVTTGATSSNTLNIPTLRLTDKVSPNPVRIVGYRWSTAQQVYYQFTSLTSPTLNSTTVDYVTIVDTLADSAILGQTLLYTTGGVLENIAAPASADSCLFDNRLWLIDAEDPNLLWYSKQVIQNTPVEMSDLLTMYVAPTTGAQASTGPTKCISAMDDKLIIFKANALYYINGTGPDNTGANNGYTQPQYITSVAGSSNPNSIILIPTGIMFQSNKGIWMLGRDMSTKYIGAPVERYNDDIILSAESIPNTTQVRFILASGITLMYDYYYDQWGVHTNIKAISACIYQGAHTYLNQYGQVLKEAPNTYIDDSQPVLIGFTTAWINIAGLQGFERFYFANLLGTYKSPFKLAVQFAFDYNPSITQSVIVVPEGNPAPNYGDEALWGSGGNWGGSDGDVLSSRIFPEKQKCQSFQVTIQEMYDPSYGIAAGEGLSLSGLALIVGVKKGYRTQRASRSFG